MMEKYGTNNSSPKVDGRRPVRENDSSILKLPEGNNFFLQLKIFS
jgi:hypothetical protein